MFRQYTLPSLTRRLGTSLALGVIIAIIGSAVEALLEHHPVIAIESLDDVLIGILVALVVFYYEQHRYRLMMDKVRVIAAMNHHVRNALQTISWSPYTQQEKQLKMVNDSVNRIEWALREILPGESEDALNEGHEREDFSVPG